MSEEWKACYSAGIFTEFMEQRGPGHTVGSGKNLSERLLDYKKDIQDALDALDYAGDLQALKSGSS